MRRRITCALTLCLSWAGAAGAQDTTGTPDTIRFTHADTLRGSITPERAWWDVTFYDLHVAIHPADSSISGYNGITYRVVSPAREMQIDLMTPLRVDSIVQEGHSLRYRRDGNAFFVTLTAVQPIGRVKTVTVYYQGRPRIAKNAPWDGGFIWTHDSLGHVWVSTACQGVGASIWWPNKDTPTDEPDSQRIAITVPTSMIDVSNGRLRSTVPHADGSTTYEWFVNDPINNYDVAVNAGTYAHFGEVYRGVSGPLTLDFWPLAYHVSAAKRQFQQARSMLACFESWFGPYPWYRDGYKLVETPYLGMEHQSAISYGNGYTNGYAGKDLSRTGWGMRWDFIIIHESGHEWFGNSITASDRADLWVHESFTDYAEALYTECQFGKAAGAAYVIGLRKRVKNDAPIIAHFGVNAEGSEDMYWKGANMLHTMRQIIHNDSTWRSLLRGLNTTFYHQVVTGQQIEAYINAHAGRDFSTLFQQYLTTTKIPVLEYKLSDSTLTYRWTNVVPHFDMPVRVSLSEDSTSFIYPTETWQSVIVHLAKPADFHVDENFYVTAKRVE